MSLIMPGIAIREVMVYRTVPGSRVNGRWVEGGEDSFPIEASDQPATGEERRNLPDGVRSDDVRKLYTSEELLAENKDTGQEADQIERNGKRYKVVKVYGYDFGEFFGYNKVMIEKI